MQYPDNRLRELVNACWCMYDQLHDQDFVVRPAIPILYFGDSHRYFSSALKVVTVGLNPSSLEFPIDCRMRRFPAAASISVQPAQRDHQCHLAALDAYFQSTSDPYKSWFASFEPILNGMEASFYDGQISTALHTDLCSPLATDPTWSKLPADRKALVKVDGLRIWHSLIETLAPDVILVSVAKEYVEQVRFPVVASREIIWELDRQNPYRVWRTIFGINSKLSLMAFGRAAQKPFGTLSNEKKRELGRVIKEQCRALAK